ncbi:metal-dependent hydrolase [Natrononativus amylolyticus]|uniref:metal-dependent hydrolase n=1 Tax=Natrononativus amylolyticus TaxID=2963434 RepID=UPI003CE52457
MATTHAIGGLTLAAAVAVVAPEFALVVAVAALIGGFFPDFDLYVGHRKTLHYPVYYSLAALLVGGLALVRPTVETVAVAAFLASAALHSVMDVFGGGLELRPWERTSERAVYSHFHGRWLPPRRWVRYDGAPEDVALASVLAVPGLLVFEGAVQAVLLAILLISVGYATIRKPLVRVTERLVALVPAPLRRHLPDRFHPATEGSDTVAG